MKALAILALIFGVLFLIMGGAVYQIMKKKSPDSKATKIVGWVSVGLLGAMCLTGLIEVIVTALS